MRRVLVGALSLLLFCGFTARQSFELPESVYLICKPPLDRSDRDPVIETAVSAEFDKQKNDAITRLDVVHRSYYGKSYDRTDQYDADLVGKLGHYEWSWIGDLKRNRRYKMIGTLFWNGKWNYREVLFVDGRADMNTLFACKEGNGH